jgi:MYXO-CTERM domain-containing protein
LSVVADNGDVRAGYLPMRFVGDGSVGFQARLEPGERMSLLRQALPAGRRFTLRIGAPDFTDMNCGLIDTQGFRASTQPCDSVVVLDDRASTEGRLGVYLELPTTATTPREIRYVAVASDAARDGDGDEIPDVLDNCPNDWNPSQQDCVEVPEGAGGAGGEGGEAGSPAISGAGGEAGNGGAGEGGVREPGEAGAAGDGTAGAAGDPDGGANESGAGGVPAAGGTFATTGGGAGEGATPSAEGGSTSVPPTGGSAGQAGTSAGATATKPAPKRESGCGCRTHEGGAPGASGWLALALAAFTLRRRRRV